MRWCNDRERDTSALMSLSGWMDGSTKALNLKRGTTLFVSCFNQVELLLGLMLLPSVVPSGLAVAVQMFF